MIPQNLTYSKVLQGSQSYWYPNIAFAMYWCILNFTIFTANHYKCLNFDIQYNPLTPRSDWHVTSPWNIHTLSSKQVMRILKLTKWKLLSWSNVKFLLFIHKDMCSSKRGEVTFILRVKGIKMSTAICKMQIGVSDILIKTEWLKSEPALFELSSLVDYFAMFSLLRLMNWSPSITERI